ncbi:MAG: creatininase family protein [Methylotenera sp.]
MTMEWSKTTWDEIPAKLKAANCSAILPIGATEQHGPHMGCGMDYVLADVLCKAVAEKTKVLMLPTMPYGCSIGHSQRWPGTIALQPITLINTIKDMGDWAYHSGVRRLFIVNAHVTNAAPLRCALEMLRAAHDDMMIAVINTAHLSKRAKEFQHADGDDWHANDGETSLMLATASEMVRPDKLKMADDPDRTAGLVFSHPVNRTSLNGVTGTPSIASKEKGDEWFAWMVEDLSGVVTKGTQENPPLEYSYFDKFSD